MTDSSPLAQEPSLRPKSNPPSERNVFLSSRYAVGLAPSDDAAGRWVKMPAPDHIRDGLVWHYTTTAGVLGILDSNVLWASAANLLNDATEIEHGLWLFGEAIKRRLNDDQVDSAQRDYLQRIGEVTTATLRAGEIFVACASLESDDLGQWRGYAAGSGYSIGIDPHVGLGPVIGEDAPPIYESVQEPSVEWRRVLYLREQQDAMLDEVTAFITYCTPDPDRAGVLEDDRVVATVIQTVARLKHPGFAPEQEVRLVVPTRRLQRVKRFRPGPFGVTGYVELTVLADTSFALLAGPPRFALPIRAVTVGPAQDQDTAVAALQAYLRAKGRDGEVTVYKAEVPYR